LTFDPRGIWLTQEQLVQIMYVGQKLFVTFHGNLSLDPLIYLSTS